MEEDCAVSEVISRTGSYDTRVIIFRTTSHAKEGARSPLAWSPAAVLDTSLSSESDGGLGYPPCPEVVPKGSGMELVSRGGGKDSLGH